MRATAKIITAVVFCFIFVFGFLYPPKISYSANTCYPNVTLDYYWCGKITQDANGNRTCVDQGFLFQGNFSCDTADPSCSTYNSICSSNDLPLDCVPAFTANMGWYCKPSKTCSKGQCWGYCNENNWSACTVSCGGGTQTNDCGTTVACNTQSCCTASSPDTPSLSSPANTAQVRVGVAASLGWNGIASWGTGCPSNSNQYEVCVMSGGTCDLVNYASAGTNTSYSWTPAAADPVVTWKVRANNGSSTAESTTRTVCAEGGTVFGAWGTCNASHKRTRTCTETCGTDDCAAADAAGLTTEDCVGTITGTLFDASDLTTCPGDIGTNPAYALLRYGSQTFGLTGAWPIVNPPASTNANGVYSESVYASTLPAVYNYDYTDLISAGKAAGVKLECQSSVATVTDQAQVVTKDTGFWRVYGGWWQTVGGSVYAKSGIKSSIPSSVSPSGDQKLILADASGKSGMLSYGVPWTGEELGTNVGAAVSTPGWRIESIYGSQRYDYAFYKTRMGVFASTAWDGGTINYDDLGLGYQIFKHTGNVTLNYGGPTGTQKVILLVDGDVNISSNVTVPSGAFFAVIASGNITIGTTNTVIEGWYDAENINFPCTNVSPADGTCDLTDGQLRAAGSFVGWTGVNLKRDMGAGNNSAPSELFTYRSDFMLSAPTPIKVYTRKFSPFIP